MAAHGEPLGDRGDSEAASVSSLRMGRLQGGPLGSRSEFPASVCASLGIRIISREFYCERYQASWI